MNALLVSDTSIQLTLSVAEAQGLLMVAEEFVQEVADRFGESMADARRTAREILREAIAAQVGSSLHPEYSVAMAELDVRRDQLPGVPRLARKYARAAAKAFRDAFEAGFRGWAKINPYLRRDCAQAWFDGYSAGEDAYRAAVMDRRQSVAFADGYKAGLTGHGENAHGDAAVAAAWQKGLAATCEFEGVAQ